MEDYSEVFLSYANNSLIEDPKNYLKILETIKKHRKVLKLRSIDIRELRVFIKILTQLTECREKAYHEINKQESIYDERYFIKYVEKTIYGYEDSVCETKCLMRTKVQGIIDDNLFTGAQRLKCLSVLPVIFYIYFGYNM
ncbi:MAG: hypothetical protein HQK76_19275 [Desulfobacterales bacterium]|nr:hypothetical protein [Desulfobacterales bacterium]